MIGKVLQMTNHLMINSILIKEFHKNKYINEKITDFYFASFSGITN